VTRIQGGRPAIGQPHHAFAREKGQCARSPYIKSVLRCTQVPSPLETTDKSLPGTRALRLLLLRIPGNHVASRPKGREPSGSDGYDPRPEPGYGITAIAYPGTSNLLWIDEACNPIPKIKNPFNPKLLIDSIIYKR